MSLQKTYFSLTNPVTHKKIEGIVHDLASSAPVGSFRSSLFINTIEAAEANRWKQDSASLGDFEELDLTFCDRSSASCITEWSNGMVAER